LGGVQKGLKAGPVHAHIVSPFKDLQADVSHEGLGLPVAKYHDLANGGVHEEKALGHARG
jgi:hypothetical protein